MRTTVRLACIVTFIAIIIKTAHRQRSLCLLEFYRDKIHRLRRGVSSSQKISGTTLIFREPCMGYPHVPYSALFYTLAATIDMFDNSVRHWSSGTLAAAAMTFVSGSQYRSRNVDYQFFSKEKAKRLIKFSL